MSIVTPESRQLTLINRLGLFARYVAYRPMFCEVDGRCIFEHDIFMKSSVLIEPFRQGSCQWPWCRVWQQFVVWLSARQNSEEGHTSREMTYLAAMSGAYAGKARLVVQLIINISLNKSRLSTAGRMNIKGEIWMANTLISPSNMFCYIRNS